MKSHIISAVILGLLMGLTASLTAQPQRHHRPHIDKSEFKAMHKEMRGLFEEKIIPTIKPQREKLDTYLSQSEKNELTQIRQGLKELAEEQKSMRRQSEGKRHERGEMSEERREAFRNHMKARRQLMTKAWAIVDAHETEIDQLLEEVKPELEKIREEGKTIREKYLPQRGEEAGRGKGRHRGHGRGFRGPDGGMRHLTRPLGFLLWNPAEPLPAPVEQSELSVFPNPTRAANQLEYEVNNAGSVSIKLINEQAEVLREIVNEYKEAGTYKVQVDLSELKEGLYFYQIKTADGVQTKKVVVRR